MKHIAIALAATLFAGSVHAEEWNIATLNCSNKAGIEHLMKDIIGKSAAAKKGRRSFFSTSRASRSSFLGTRMSCVAESTSSLARSSTMAAASSG